MALQLGRGDSLGVGLLTSVSGLDGDFRLPEDDTPRAGAAGAAPLNGLFRTLSFDPLHSLAATAAAAAPRGAARAAPTAAAAPGAPALPRQAAPPAGAAGAAPRSRPAAMSAAERQARPRAGAGSGGRLTGARPARPSQAAAAEGGDPLADLKAADHRRLLSRWGKALLRYAGVQKTDVERRTGSYREKRVFMHVLTVCFGSTFEGPGAWWYDHSHAGSFAAALLYCATSGRVRLEGAHCSALFVKKEPERAASSWQVNEPALVGWGVAPAELAALFRGQSRMESGFPRGTPLQLPRPTLGGAAVGDAARAAGAAALLGAAGGSGAFAAFGAAAAAGPSPGPGGAGPSAGPAPPGPGAAPYPSLSGFASLPRGLSLPRVPGGSGGAAAAAAAAAFAAAANAPPGELPAPLCLSPPPPQPPPAGVSLLLAAVPPPSRVPSDAALLQVPLSGASSGVPLPFEGVPLARQSTVATLAVLMCQTEALAAREGRLVDRQFSDGARALLAHIACGQHQQQQQLQQLQQQQLQLQQQQQLQQPGAYAAAAAAGQAAQWMHAGAGPGAGIVAPKAIHPKPSPLKRVAEEPPAPPPEPSPKAAAKVVAGGGAKRRASDGAAP